MGLDVGLKVFYANSDGETVEIPQYYRKGKATVAVSPHNTNQNCSNCGQKVPKSLSTRTHICPHCGYVEDRDINAAINILKKGLSTVGHTETNTLGERFPLV